MRTAEERKCLPKWAQADMNHLEMDVAFWKRKALALGSTEPTDTQAEIGTALDAKLMLPNSTEVRFILGPHDEDYLDVRIETDGQRGAPRYVYVCGGTTLQVTPWSSNVVKLAVKR